ncbi:MAG TPA: S49 family peptidase, partial [Pirellulales bacterium]|nr:S49 family peptidase [Pirellulales bacterium]
MEPEASRVSIPPSTSPTTVVIEQRRGRGFFRALAIVFVVLVLGGLTLSAMAVAGAIALLAGTSDSQVEEKYHSLSKTALNKVAIITVEGTIIDGENVKKQIDHAHDDEHVKAIVLRIDSPGGSVTGSDYIYHHLVKLRKDRKLPIVVSMGGIAASGGYYVAMAIGDEKDVIFAEPTTWTGSIGVVIPHFDLSGFVGKLDVS